MRHFFFILGTISLVACGSPQATDTRNNTDTGTIAKTLEPEPVVDLTVPPIPADYKKRSMKETGLDATLMLSKEAYMQKSTLSDNEGTRDEHIVYAFEVPTGNNSPDGVKTVPGQLEIYTTTWTLQQHKDRISTSSISGWQRFVKETPDYFIYATHPGNTSNQPLRAKDKSVYQFLKLVKSKKDNKTYCIRSGGFDLTAEEMLRLFAIAETVEL